MFNRDKITTALKLCKSCLRSTGSGHEKSCIVMKLKNKKNKSGKTKYEFTCKDEFCFRHMWLCVKHKLGNQESMDRKAADLEQKHGFKLIHFLGSHRPAVQNCHSQNDNPNPTPLPLQVGPTANNKSFKAAENKSFKVAEKKLRRKSVDKSVEIVPIPDGTPMFMFQQLKGKTKPVNAFYDSGCSNACLRKGIPGVQLQGQKLASGPFSVIGVQGVTIEASDEWLVHLDRADGRKQLLRAITLDCITGESPLFNVEAATKDLKDDKPTDCVLQNLCVPKCVGGEVDILIGTLYNLIFPKPVHHLPNGLTIYSCVLASHDSSINATIGGPHTSFQLMADSVGGAAKFLMHFANGLEKFKQWGPPPIKDNPLTFDEDMHAKLLNKSEGEKIFQDLVITILKI